MPYRQKGSPYWYAYFYRYDVKTGRRIRTRRSTETADRREAEALEAKWKAEAHQQKHWNSPVPVRVEEVLTEYLTTTASAKRSHQQDEIRAVTLVQSLIGVDAYRLGPAHVRQYITRRRSERVRDSTINRELALLSAAINTWNLGHDIDLPNPVEGRKLKEPPGRDRWITRTESRRLIEEAERGKSPWLADFIRIALYTGMRKEEILGLEWNRVDFGSGNIYLSGQQTKSEKPRSIPLMDIARQALAGRLQFRMRYCPQSAWVFAKSDGSRVKDVREGFYAACERAGIENFHIHDCRHTCASWMVQSGVGIEKVSQLLGHSDIRVTQRYSHLRDDDLRAAMQEALNLPDFCQTGDQSNLQNRR